jgi:hypothetical protein
MSTGILIFARGFLPTPLLLLQSPRVSAIPDTGAVLVTPET